MRGDEATHLDATINFNIVKEAGIGQWTKISLLILLIDSLLWIVIKILGKKTLLIRSTVIVLTFPEHFAIINYP